MAASTPNFASDVAPILQKHCLACHSSTVHKSGLVLESYEGLMKGGKHGQVVVPSNAPSSRIIEMLEGKITPQMPADDDPLPDSDIAKIKAWINAGAQRSCAERDCALRSNSDNAGDSTRGFGCIPGGIFAILAGRKGACGWWIPRSSPFRSE